MKRRNTGRIRCHVIKSMETHGKTMDIKTVNECNRCLGGKTFHPHAGLINLEHPDFGSGAVRFEFYAVLLFEENADDCGCCGRKHYDFSDSTMVFLTPGEMFRMGNNALPDKGWLLAFHPDLLFRTSLKKHMSDYTFFGYNREEALHLSHRETDIIVCCLHNIGGELLHPIDSHTSTILARYIELLLDYCARFYERQFITRESKNKAQLRDMENLLDSYIVTGQLRDGQLPTADYCAQQLGLSTAYFIDLLKMETGHTFEEYFRKKRLNTARRLLISPEHTPTSVAMLLGFRNVRHFNLLFEKLTGIAPADYRISTN